MRKYFKNPRRLMNLYFSSFVFAMSLSSLLLIGVALVVLLQAKILVLGELESTGTLAVLFLLNAGACSVIGTVLSAIFSKTLFKPIFDLIDGMNQLTSGKYDIRVNLGKSELSQKISESFNTLATELEGTEMLREDFVNNFSHEFKTPIVSIAGFAKLLKRGNLTVDEQNEYIDIIESESLRLSSMATSVLTMTKLENQSVLTNVTEYNLSEQLRTCVLLLENEWLKKNTDIRLEFDEYTIKANYEMMQQVWINLLDNAIKYSPENSIVEVAVLEQSNQITVSIANTGSQIAPEYRKKIFNKFYQIDESHSGNGNGIGLAIVKRVAELHKGTVDVRNENGKTVFAFMLPQ